jgi:type IV pilus assembly protein PilM
MNFSKVKDLMNIDISDIKNKITNKPIETKIPKKKEFNKKVVSFDFGSDTTKVVVGKYSKGLLEIERLISAKTPVDAVGDGNILNQEMMSVFLEQLLTNNKINVKDAVCTNNSTSIINREVTIPAVQEDEINTVVKYEIQQYLPINMDDYIIQQTILDRFQVESKLKFKALVITYPDKLATKYYKLLSNANLKPFALDISYNSLNKLVNYGDKVNGEEYSKEQTLAFIDMGASTLNVNIYKNGKLEFTRIIKSGGFNIDAALSRRLEVSLETAEIEKKAKADLSMSENNEASKVAADVVDEWLSELERIIQFYRNKKVGNSIDKIFLYGGSSNLKGMEKYVFDRLSIPTNKVRTIGNVDLNLKLTNETLEQYLNAIGAIIRL